MDQVVLGVGKRVAAPTEPYEPPAHQGRAIDVDLAE
jgi:hypothetical protein